MAVLEGEHVQKYACTRQSVKLSEAAASRSFWALSGRPPTFDLLFCRLKTSGAMLADHGSFELSKAPGMWKNVRAAAVLVLRGSVRLSKVTPSPPASSGSNRSRMLNGSRSSLETTRTSPDFRRGISASGSGRRSTPLRFLAGRS